MYAASLFSPRSGLAAATTGQPSCRSFSRTPPHPEPLGRIWGYDRTPGEVPAAPSAPLLDGIAVGLIDVADEVRRDRLAVRDAGRWDADAVDVFLGWTAEDPRWCTHLPEPRPAGQVEPPR